jgi:hypothetical protein
MAVSHARDECLPKPSIANSKHIRSLYDTINKYQSQKAFKNAQAFNVAAENEPFCLVLEWMDEPLSKLDPENTRTTQPSWPLCLRPG